MGIAQEMFELPAETCDVRSLRAQLVARGGASAAALGRARRCAFRSTRIIARDDTPVKQGDEIAFFPPVTGG